MKNNPMDGFLDNYLEASFECGNWPDEEKIRLLDYNYADLLPVRKDAKILEIGVGLGELLVLGRRRGYANVLGIDISSSVVKFCMAHDLPCELVDNTSEWLGRHKGEFDFISLSHVLEHLDKQEVVGFVKAIRDSLAPNGVLVITVPNMQAPDSNLYRYHDITHEIGFTERSLHQVLFSAGFSEVVFRDFESIFYLHRHLKSFCAMPFRGVKHLLFAPLRALYRRWVRIVRSLNGNMSPAIIGPCLMAVARQSTDS